MAESRSMHIQGSAQEYIDRLTERFKGRVSLALKNLLEKRHLYQSEIITVQDLMDSIIASAGMMSAEDLKTRLLNRIETDWLPYPEAPDVKLFCAKCDRLEAFNSVHAVNIFGDRVAGFQDNSKPVQVFAFSFLCQSCKAVPEVFLVRRQGLKLTLCGRAPIEHVEAPPFIPRQIQPFFRGGVLAFHSGQTLAGNFMLRTLVEQWARLATGLEAVTKADIVMDAYMDSLPKDFKDRFPSMRDLYAALSSDIHGAVGSPDLFERAQKEIVEHFDARRLFKLNLTPPL